MQDETGKPTLHQPEALTAPEMAPLWRWAQQTTWLQASAMGALLLGSVAIHRYGDVAWLRLLVLSAVMLLVAAAAALQLRGRCPRCRARLRSKLMSVLPDQCHRCGVALPSPPRSGGG